MADILIDNQTAPSTPGSGKSVIFIDSTSKRLCVMDDGGTPRGLLSGSASTALTTCSSVDTWITGSDIIIPSFGMKAGQLYRWTLNVSKSAAGTAAAVVVVRTGSLRTTSDTARSTMTATIAQSAAAVSAIIHVICHVRSVSATGQIICGFGPTQVYGTTAGTQGLGSGVTNVPSTFDNSAMQGLYASISINPGASGVWTVDSCTGELIG